MVYCSCMEIGSTTRVLPVLGKSLFLHKLWYSTFRKLGMVSGCRSVEREHMSRILLGFALAFVSFETMASADDLNKFRLEDYPQRPIQLRVQDQKLSGKRDYRLPFRVDSEDPIIYCGALDRWTAVTTFDACQLRFWRPKLSISLVRNFGQ